MKLFQRTAKDGNELGDLLEPAPGGSKYRAPG